MLGNGIFSIFGAGLNTAMSSGAANEQWGNQLKLMDIQNRYNEQMAKNNQLRNKDLWDYTNYENQKQHIKNAGLNPALMYGMGGKRLHAARDVSVLMAANQPPKG